MLAAPAGIHHCPHSCAHTGLSILLAVPAGWRLAPPDRLAIHTPQGYRSYRCQAASNDNLPANIRLSQAASRYAEGLEAGLDADDLVAQELGSRRAKDLPESLLKYKDKVKAKLEQQAEQEREDKQQSIALFTLGKKAYEKGQYVASSELLYQALEEAEGPYTKLAGDIQLWLGLAYQACGREAECIQLYKTVEKSHPTKRVRKEAANLRFILEAPRLTVGADERVQLPVMGKTERVLRPRGKVSRQSSGSGGGIVRERKPKTLEEQFWATYRPPELVPNNGYLLAASVALALGLAAWSATLTH